MAKFKILSIDGGGIRGIIPARILAEIEHRTGKRIHELFDLIAGTSTGGILALGLLAPNQDKSGSKYAASEMLGMYFQEGKHIFPDPRFAPSWLTNLFRPKYSGDGREEVLHRYFKNAYIADALANVLITSYDTELRMPIIFSNQLNEIGENYRILCNSFMMWQVAMATSAAPTFFPPFKSGNNTLVDGGMYANNPTNLAIATAIANSRQSGDLLNLNDLLILSLGTGSLIRKYRYQETKNWGLIKWVNPIIDILMDGQSEFTSCQIEQTLAGDRYYRFQPLLTRADDDMDNCSSKNMAALLQSAEFLITKKSNAIDKLCEQLT